MRMIRDDGTVGIGEKTIGQIAYEAFAGKDRGEAFDDLEPIIREGWEDAARAVAGAEQARCLAICDLYIAAPPSNEDARGGYLNAAQGIRGRVSANVY